MKLNQILKNKTDFNNLIIEPLKLLFPAAEWLDETKTFMSFDTIFGILDLYYGDRDIRYDHEKTFINKFIFELADVLPDIYAKQLVFVKKELYNFLSSSTNRAIKVLSGTTSNKDQRTNSKSGSSTTPTNMVVTDAVELEKLPINSANLNHLQIVDNYNSENEQTNFNFINDLIKQLNSDFSLRLKKFMNMLEHHFSSIQITKNKIVENDLYCGLRFRNGFYLNDVDYLGVENQDKINNLSGKIQANKTEIDTINAKINVLPNDKKLNELKDLIQENKNSINVLNNDLNGINNFVQENGVKISDLEQTQETQNTLIAQNTTQITTNKNELKQLYNQLLNKTQELSENKQDKLNPNILDNLNNLDTLTKTVENNKQLIFNNIQIIGKHDGEIQDNERQINKVIENYFNLKKDIGTLENPDNVVVGYTKFNKHLIVPEPTSAFNPATKKYVDNALKNKQDKLKPLGAIKMDFSTNEIYLRGDLDTALNKLPNLIKKVDELEKRIQALENKK